MDIVSMMIGIAIGLLVGLAAGVIARKIIVEKRRGNAEAQAKECDP